MTGLYEGWSVRRWSQYQTLNPGRNPPVMQWFSGYDLIHNSPMNEVMPRFPLDIRYQDFKERLKAAISKARE